MATMVTPLPPVSDGEEGAGDDAHDREAARHPPEERARRGDEAVGRLRLGEHVADERGYNDEVEGSNGIDAFG